MFQTDRITGEEVLNIFSSFRTNPELPKYNNSSETSTKLEFVATGSFLLSPTSASIFNWSLQGDNASASGSQRKPNFIIQIFKSLYAKIREKRKNNVTKVFKLILDNLEQVTVADARISKFKKFIEQAQHNGQIALVEQLHAEFERNVNESGLVATGFDKFIESRSLIHFYKNCEKGLSLDWIQNFTRYIPESVMARKANADSYKIFDNYVVLHYDPQKKAFKLTKAEIEKKKDPILFGVFKGSTRLYFIGDWVDEFCDLSFDQLTEAINIEDKTLP